MVQRINYPEPNLNTYSTGVYFKDMNMGTPEQIHEVFEKVSKLVERVEVEITRSNMLQTKVELLQEKVSMLEELVRLDGKVPSVNTNRRIKV